MYTQLGEVYVVAKNISIQSRCLLEDILHFYLDFTVYDMPNSRRTHFHGITELRRRHVMAACSSIIH